MIPPDRLLVKRDALTRATARSFDPIRRRLFRIVLGWARRYAPYREEALFYVGATRAMMRQYVTGLASARFTRVAAEYARALVRGTRQTGPGQPP